MDHNCHPSYLGQGLEGSWFETSLDKQQDLISTNKPGREVYCYNSSNTRGIGRKIVCLGKKWEPI
jgi:hypothetical protein